MKKAICILLTAALCVLIAVTALADASGAADFLRLLEQNGVACAADGLTETGGERVLLPGGDGVLLCAAEVVFHPDGDRVTLCARELVTTDDADRVRVLRAVNELNFSYKYVRFYVEEDGAVSCAMDLILHEGGDAAAIALEGLMRLDSILRHALPALEAYSK